jgi:hypothetical protein
MRAIIRMSSHAFTHTVRSLQTTLEQMKTANADLVKAAEAKSIFLATTSHGTLFPPLAVWLCCD